MEPLSNKRKVLDFKPLTLAERSYLPAIIKGMGITIKHFFKKDVTIRYPEQKREFSENFRGLHSLKRDENGAERCTACGLCALSCPAEAITMTAAERQKWRELVTVAPIMPVESPFRSQSSGGSPMRSVIAAPTN